MQRSDRRVVAHLLRDDTVALLLVNQFIRFTEERVERLAVSEEGREGGRREGEREGGRERSMSNSYLGSEHSLYGRHHCFA